MISSDEDATTGGEYAFIGDEDAITGNAGTFIRDGDVSIGGRAATDGGLGPTRATAART
jgi:hypothetical protein